MGVVAGFVGQTRSVCVRVVRLPLFGSGIFHVGIDRKVPKSVY